MTLPDKLQHPAAGRGYPDTTLRAEPLRGAEGVVQAPTMIMVRFGKAVAGMCQDLGSVALKAASLQ